MRTTVTKTTLYVLLAIGLQACGGAEALAGTGGVSAGPIAPAKPGVHKAALATWFGPGFYGQTTACGQTLTPDTVGVANRTLACGTLVRLSYRGRLLTAPVIDRGPYGNNGAEWDLTTGAARSLGVLDTVRLRARVVGSVPNSPALGAPPASPAAALTGGASPS
jgi:rare lipoprotein A (peptidoglycan hydrolase)